MERACYIPAKRCKGDHVGNMGSSLRVRNLPPDLKTRFHQTAIVATGEVQHNEEAMRVAVEWYVTMKGREPPADAYLKVFG